MVVATSAHSHSVSTTAASLTALIQLFWDSPLDGDKCAEIINAQKLLHLKGKEF